MDNVTAFGTIFKAYGCTLDYQSKESKLYVTDPDDLVDRALKEIQCFEDTANFVDGAAALALADTIDMTENPLSEEIRENILHALKIKDRGAFVYQVLSLQKNNRSWHGSEVAGDCSFFGEVCTHRGINPNPERKGRTSSREPSAYHRAQGNGKIAREQLVTPALEQLWKSIPQTNFISGRITIVPFDLKSLKKLPIEDRLNIVKELSEELA